jgi:tRNA G10  N-methylase Trm11
MLVDIVNFAACMLVDNGRLSFWMPTANDEDQELAIPSHPALEMTSNCVQVFHKCMSHTFAAAPYPQLNSLQGLVAC